ncbi:MAG: NUDIX domain-containing protein [Jatrophihabitantaceae bacterium]
MTAPTLRIGGRALLIDPEGRVLLIHERVEVGTHWLTPGGGLEPDELPWQAAVREVFEETGIVIHLGANSPEVLTTRRLWSWRHLHFDQTDHFFMARVPVGVNVVPQALTEVESLTVLGHDWWTAEQLRTTGEQVVPDGLADLLDELGR